MGIESPSKGESALSECVEIVKAKRDRRDFSFRGLASELKTRGEPRPGIWLVFNRFF